MRTFYYRGLHNLAENWSWAPDVIGRDRDKTKTSASRDRDETKTLRIFLETRRRWYIILTHAISILVNWVFGHRGFSLRPKLSVRSLEPCNLRPVFSIVYLFISLSISIFKQSILALAQRKIC